MNKTRILVIDDELSIVKFLRANLEDSGYAVEVALDGNEGLRSFEKELPDLVILDIMMPEIDGFEVCRRIREWSQVPIIMLSARGSESDKVKCLDLGADDYVTKPFGKEELIARVKAVMRRTESYTSSPVQPLFTSGDLVISFSKRLVTVAGEEVKLTPTEYNLLQELVLHENKALTHSMLLGRVWGPEYAEEREYLRVFIGRLRKKLESSQEKNKYIITIPGVGYRFKTTP